MKTSSTYLFRHRLVILPGLMNLVMGLILGAVGNTNAVAQELTFSNAPQVDIQVEAARGISIQGGQGSESGDILVRCKLEAGRCVGIGSAGGNTALAPTTVITRIDNLTRLIPGSSIRLRWSSDRASVCKASTVGPVATTWNGARVNSRLTGEYVTLNAVGTYVFSLRCYNNAGESDPSSVTATVEVRTSSDPDPLPPPVINPGDPDAPNDPVSPDYNCQQSGIQPPGFTRVDKTWVDAWDGPANPSRFFPVFPNSPGVVPIGTNKDTILVIPFVPTANVSYGIGWDMVQSAPFHDYVRPRVADSMFFTISPCPGDLRAPMPYPDPSNNDQFLSDGCRRANSSDGLTFGTLEGFRNNPLGCFLVPGQVYYMNISPVDPNFVAPGFHTCAAVANSINGCDVQAKHFSSGG